MEGFVNQNEVTTNNVEDFSLYKMLRDEAPQKAEELIAQIEGYADMDLDAKIEALIAKEEELIEGGNENRFIAKEVARQCEMLKAEMTFANTMRSLEKVA